jgi:hypothetical protein
VPQCARGLGNPGSPGLTKQREPALDTESGGENPAAARGLVSPRMFLLARYLSKACGSIRHNPRQCYTANNKDK